MPWCGQQTEQVSRNTVQASGERERAPVSKAASFRALEATTDRQRGAHRTTQVC